MTTSIFPEDYDGTSPSEEAIKEQLEKFRKKPKKFDPKKYGNAGGEKAHGTQLPYEPPCNTAMKMGREKTSDSPKQGFRSVKKEVTPAHGEPMPPVDWRALHGNEGLEKIEVPKKNFG